MRENQSFSWCDNNDRFDWLGKYFALTGNYTSMHNHKQIIPLAIKVEDDATLFYHIL
jgi:hypothetical protein